MEGVRGVGESEVGLPKWNVAEWKTVNKGKDTAGITLNPEF